MLYLKVLYKVYHPKFELMRFISGLKNLSKQTILLIILSIFIVFWFLFFFGVAIFKNLVFIRYLSLFLGIFAGFTFVLLIISFFIPIENITIIIILITAALTIPVILIFGWIIDLFYLFCFFANAAITAFFAFKFCMDTSTKVDDYLYKKERSRIATRIIEFVIFLFLSWWFMSLTTRFFRSFPNPGIQSLANIFFNLFWIGFILITVTLIRLIFTNKLAGYITLFDVLTFFYVLYLVVDLWAEFIFFDSSGYDLFSFCIDLLLFFYIIGSIFERVDYIKEKLKIFRAGTIALFVILMKIVVQMQKISQEFLTLGELALQVILQVQVLWIFFIIFTLVVGIYTIFKHKEGKSS